ncbi:hypothetical protein [Clostridium felsineum]|uniref:hypothetical protein n=1 Tax=Clostridium felsineum TaxID=36839 RepID=UPI0009C52082|nr:hypothetical protein [Clostridium felsineum]URZ15341.1 hypothetical protein CLFE_013590 [Clostridium felsineum DSM 794]
MKTGELLIKIGNKLFKSSNKRVVIATFIIPTIILKVSTVPCWWLFGKPRKPRCFK